MATQLKPLAEIVINDVSAAGVTCFVQGTIIFQERSYRGCANNTVPNWSRPTTRLLPALLRLHCLDAAHPTNGGVYRQALGQRPAVGGLVHGAVLHLVAPVAAAGAQLRQRCGAWGRGETGAENVAPSCLPRCPHPPGCGSQIFKKDKFGETTHIQKIIANWQPASFLGHPILLPFEIGSPTHLPGWRSRCCGCAPPCGSTSTRCAAGTCAAGAARRSSGTAPCCCPARPPGPLRRGAGVAAGPPQRRFRM